MKAINLMYLVIIVITLNACAGKKKDACANVTCNNGGSCVSGTCSCPTAYTGTNCNTQVRSAMLGTNNAPTVYNVVDINSDTYASNSYQVIITVDSSNIAQVRIYNFNSYGNAVYVYASINSSSPNYVYTIPTQVISGRPSISIDGYFSVQGNSITGTYQLYGATNERHSFTYTRQ